MPHQNVHSSKATAQNAATDPAGAGDQTGRTGERRAEARSYAASDVADSSVAPPAAGEMADFMDDGDALGAEDVQMGGNHTNRPHRTEVRGTQGRKTIEGNRQRLKTGSADGN